VLRSVAGGGSFALRASLPRDSVSYSDNNLANGTYAYRLEVYNGAGSDQTVATLAIDVSAPVVAVATSEITVAGSVQSGSYLNTQVSAGSEQLKERQSGGKRSLRVSSLDHSWTIPGVVPAASVELYLRAYAPLNGEDEDFVFTYSVDDGAEQPAGMVVSGAAADAWTIPLPNTTNGTVVVRVVDSDRTAGNGGTDTVTIYEMHVTSGGSPADQPPAVGISDPAGDTTIVVGTMLTLSGTVTDEDTNLVAELFWTSSLDNDLGKSPSMDVMLSEGSHLVTAQVTDSAGQLGKDSVTVNVVAAGSELTATGIDSISRADLPAGVKVEITGTGFTGVPTVTFQNGSGPTPSAADVTLVDAWTLSATVSGKSGPRKSRDWDVVVTLANGVNAVCAGCLTITISP